MPTGFEWDDEKVTTNIRDHDGVTFEQAATAFSDKFAVEWIDEGEDYGEERSILLGMTGGRPFLRGLYRTGHQYPHHLSTQSNEI